MAHKEQRDFCLRVKEKYPEFFKDKKVLDIGSLDINGSNRDLFENCNYMYFFMLYISNKSLYCFIKIYCYKYPNAKIERNRTSAR